MINTRNKFSKRLQLLVLTLVLGSILPVVSASGGPITTYPRREVCDWDLGCYSSSPEPPPDSCGGNCMPTGSIPIPIRGVLLGPGDAPLGGGLVYWAYGKVLTADDGTFTLTVWNKPAVIYAKRDPNYGWNSIELADPAASAATVHQMRITFLHTTNVSKQAFNNTPQQRLTFTMFTTAPTGQSLDGLDVPNRFLLHVQDRLPAAGETPEDVDRVFTMEHDASFTSKPGWTKWQVDWLVPDDTLDGKYDFRACVLGADSSGDCDSSQGTVFSAVERPQEVQELVVDSIGPVFTQRRPLSDRNTTDPAVSIIVGTEDPLAGIDPGSITASLDGNPLSVAYSYEEVRLW